MSPQASERLQTRKSVFAERYTYGMLRDLLWYDTGPRARLSLPEILNNSLPAYNAAPYDRAIVSWAGNASRMSLKHSASVI